MTLANSISPLKNWRSIFATLMAALFMVTQAASLAHASEYGDDHHSHDGVECELVFAASELDPIIPTPVVTLIISPQDNITWVTSYSSAKAARLDNKGPPAQAHLPNSIYVILD